MVEEEVQVVRRILAPIEIEPEVACRQPGTATNALTRSVIVFIRSVIRSDDDTRICGYGFQTLDGQYRTVSPFRRPWELCNSCTVGSIFGHESVGVVVA